MWILPFVGYLGLALGFLFLTLAIASGLYYLSEIVEEHTVIAKKILTRMIYFVIASQVLLVLVDSFPLGLSALSVASHVVYMQNLRRFPVVKLTDPLFLLSCILVLLNHWLWFRHFSASQADTRMKYGYGYTYDPSLVPTFTEVASFFGLNVWLVPFALFVSLSAGDNILPSMGSEYATGEGSSFISPGRMPSSVTGGRSRHRRTGTNQGMAKATVNSVREWMSGTGEAMGFWPGENVRTL